MRSKIHERFAKKEIQRLRLQRELRKLAAREGIHPLKIDAAAASRSYLCAACLQPFTSPRILYAQLSPHAVICTYCCTAIDKCEGDLVRLRKHQRFTVKLRVPRARLARLIDLMAAPSLFGAGPLDEAPTSEPEAPPAAPDRSSLVVRHPPRG